MVKTGVHTTGEVQDMTRGPPASVLYSSNERREPKPGTNTLYKRNRASRSDMKPR